MDRIAASASGIVWLDTGSPTRRHSLLPVPAIYERRGLSSRRAVDLALQEGEREVAATFIAAQAVWESPFAGIPPKPDSRHGRARRSTVGMSKYAAGLCLALSGSSARTEALSGDLEKRFPEDTFVNLRTCQCCARWPHREKTSSRTA